MRAFATIAVALSAALVGARLPPGYEDQAWCPAGSCLRRSAGQAFHQNLVGPTSRFVQCWDPASKASVEEVWTGSLRTDVTVPEGWVEAEPCGDDEPPVEDLPGPQHDAPMVFAPGPVIMNLDGTPLSPPTSETRGEHAEPEDQGLVVGDVSDDEVREHHDGEQPRDDGERPRHHGKRHGGKRHHGKRHGGKRHHGKRHRGEQPRHHGERHGDEHHDERHHGEQLIDPPLRWPATPHASEHGPPRHHGKQPRHRGGARHHGQKRKRFGPAAYARLMIACRHVAPDRAALEALVARQGGCVKKAIRFCRHARAAASGAHGLVHARLAALEHVLALKLQTALRGGVQGAAGVSSEGPGPVAVACVQRGAERWCMRAQARGGATRCVFKPSDGAVFCRDAEGRWAALPVPEPTEPEGPAEYEYEGGADEGARRVVAFVFWLAMYLLLFSLLGSCVAACVRRVRQRRAAARKARLPTTVVVRAVVVQDEEAGPAYEKLGLAA